MRDCCGSVLMSGAASPGIHWIVSIEIMYAQPLKPEAYRRFYSDSELIQISRTISGFIILPTYR